MLFKVAGAYNDYLNLIKKAKNNVENGMPDEIINAHLFLKTSISFLSIIDNEYSKTLPLENGHLMILRNLEK